jgi:hypothetical protein
VRQLCFVCVVSAGLGCCSLDGLEAEAARLAMAVCLSRRETGGHSQLPTLRHGQAATGDDRSKGLGLGCGQAPRLAVFGW